MPKPTPALPSAAMAPQKTVLITGCSEGGIGFALATEFQARGLRVFATARTLAKMAALERLPGVTLLPLDVGSPASIDAAVAAVSAATGGSLDFLVNNAGAQYVMPVLDADMAQSKAMFDVNVWGVLAVTQAFAPLVIAARGSVVNMASIAGLMYPPFMGLYAASKAAAQTVSEALRLELQPFGVKVVTVIAGAVGTKLFANAPEHHLPEGSLYARAEKQVAARATGTDVAGRTGTPEDFARSLVADVLRGASGKVYHGKMSTMVRLITTFMPTFLLVGALFPWYCGPRVADYRQDRLALADTGLDKLGSGQ